MRTGLATAVFLTLLGIPVGLIWEAVAPRPKFVIAAGTTVIADPESQAFIAADGWYSVLTGTVGLAGGLAGYLLVVKFKDRLGELALVLGLAAGGLAGALVAWWMGHSVGLDTFEQLVRTGQDGTPVTGALDLRSSAAVLVWPLLAVMVFGLLEALDVAQRHPATAPASPAPAPPAGTGYGLVPAGAGGTADAVNRETDTVADPERAVDTERAVETERAVDTEQVTDAEPAADTEAGIDTEPAGTERAVGAEPEARAEAATDAELPTGTEPDTGSGAAEPGKA
jgi:hypothetical protein